MAITPPGQEQHNKPVVAITGASGLLGARLTERLSPAYELVLLDIQEPEVKPLDATFFKCDLTSDEDTGRVLADVANGVSKELASVLHLAAYYDFGGGDSPLYEKLTVQGTRRMAQGLRKHFDKVEQLVFSSSILVMEPAEESGEETITEDSPLKPKWDYPQSKVEAEKVLEQEHGDIPAVVLRIGGVYDEDGNSLPLTHHISRIHQRQLESYFFPGDADHGQAFVHLDDLMDCFEKVVENRRRLGDYEVYLVAEETIMSHEELQDAIGDNLFGKEWPTIWIAKPLAKAGAFVKEHLTNEQQFIKPWMVDLADDHFPVAIRKSREELGWSPKHSLRDTIPEMIRRLKQDPRGWYERNNLDIPEDFDEIVAKHSGGNGPG